MFATLNSNVPLNPTVALSGEVTEAPRFARPDAYARRIGCSRRHVERLMNRGLLPFLKTGHRTVLIPLQEADAALLKLAVGKAQKGAAL